MLSTQWFTEDWLDQILNSKKLKMVIRVSSGPFMFYSRIISLRIKWPKVLFYPEIFVCFCSFRKLTWLRSIKQNAISWEDYVLIGCPLVFCCHSTIIPIPKEELKGTFSADNICHTTDLIFQTDKMSSSQSLMLMLISSKQTSTTKWRWLERQRAPSD